jgi:hypothetical protein
MTDTTSFLVVLATAAAAPVLGALISPDVFSLAERGARAARPPSFATAGSSRLTLAQ